MKVHLGGITYAGGKVIIEDGNKIAVEFPNDRDVFVSLAELKPAEDLFNPLTKEQKEVIEGIERIYLYPIKGWPHFGICFKDGREIWIQILLGELNIVSPETPGIEGMYQRISIPKVASEINS